MNEKNKKTLYLPVWVADLLDDEGELLDGTGVVAGAAIYLFCGLSPEEKVCAITEYTQRDMSKAYETEKPSDADQQEADKKRVQKTLLDAVAKAKKKAKASPQPQQ